MRIRRFSFLLSLGAMASCSYDRVVTAREPSPHPSPGASINLSTTGGVPLYQSYARAINDSAVAVGSAQATLMDPDRAVMWAPPNYAFEFLPDLGGRSRASSIGNDGTIGGYVCDPGAAANAPCHPAYWRNGRLHQLAGFGAVSDVCPCDGHTLVGHTLVGGRDHAAIWVDEILIDIGVPPRGGSGELVAVSNGWFVGHAFDGVLEGDDAHRTQLLSYRWSPSAGWTVIGIRDIEHDDPDVIDVNSRGTAIGAAGTIWRNGASTFTYLPGNGLPSAINDSGIVAGECIPGVSGATTEYVPCEWTEEGGWSPIGSETNAVVLGINNENVAVGELFDQGRAEALMWVP